MNKDPSSFTPVGWAHPRSGAATRSAGPRRAGWRAREKRRAW